MSRLDRMYAMHDGFLLPTSIRMTVLRYVGTSYHFTICLEVYNHAIDMYKALLGKPELHFDSSFFASISL